MKDDQDPSIFENGIKELRTGMALHDSGTEIWGVKVDNAIEEMIATGVVLVVYHAQTLNSIYANVWRRNDALNPGVDRHSPAYVMRIQIWTYKEEVPAKGSKIGKWYVGLRKPTDTYNPFFKLAGKTPKRGRAFGRWIVLAEDVIAGREVEVASRAEAGYLGQAFRAITKRRGIPREGHMLKTTPTEGSKLLVRLKKPLPSPPPEELANDQKVEKRIAGKVKKQITKKKKK